MDVNPNISRMIGLAPYMIMNLDIISTIYELCVGMGIRVVVEYIETNEQLKQFEKVGDFLI